MLEGVGSGWLCVVEGDWFRVVVIIDVCLCVPGDWGNLRLCWGDDSG